MNAWDTLFWGHFAALPKILDMPISENETIKKINCGLDTSMFNVAYGSLTADQHTLDQEIENVISYFNGQHFAWWIPNSNDHPQCVKRMQEYGFVRETNEIAMRCDLCKTGHYVPKTNLSVQPIHDASTLQDFISILEPYYDPKARSFFERIPLEALVESKKSYMLDTLITHLS